MRLVCLNIWGGIMLKEFMGFVAGMKATADIFCFQEVFDSEPGNVSLIKGMDKAKPDIYKDLVTELQGFNGYVAIPQKNQRGLATFVKKGIDVKKVEEFYIYGKKDGMIGNDPQTIAANMLHTAIERNGKTYDVYNLHGLWLPGEKYDDPKTIEQSRNIEKFVGGSSGSKIICGDFNLALDTESVRIVERMGFDNLVRKNGIKSTRPDFFSFPQKYADYTFVSKGIEVRGFTVLSSVVSDHLPMLLDFE
ncbi:MAG: endonuclease/exonuclease/phosphatase family protein [Candidatus Micrarchaeota archaeon]|nr:endonuclease/exonuclease/phosphatase family protein [Candidatus Micrarchaeota archaeon]